MDAVVAESQRSIAKGSRSFGAAAALFPRALREDVWQLYAWCRHCDDEIDGQDHGHALTPLAPAEQRARLERLRDLTARAMAGERVGPSAFVAFQRVALRHELSPRWPQDLLDGFALDVERARFETVQDTLVYCWGVAGVVGAMMAQIMGAQDLAVLRRAQDLGLAFQLTNICRDVAEDAAAGRVYLPADRLRAAGLAPTPQALAQPCSHPQAFEVAGELLDLAELYYASARVGLRALPFRSALAIAAARGVYRAIGRKLRRRGPAGLASRVSLSRGEIVLQLLCGVAVALVSRLERIGPTPERPALWSRI